MWLLYNFPLVLFFAQIPPYMCIYSIWQNDSFVVIDRKGDLIDSFCEDFMLPTSDYVHCSPLFFAIEKAIFIANVSLKSQLYLPSSVQALSVKRSSVHGTLRTTFISIQRQVPVSSSHRSFIVKASDHSGETSCHRTRAVDSTVFRAVGINLRGSLCD